MNYDLPLSGSSGRWKQALVDAVSLTKPKVVALLLLTTVASMFVTPLGLPSLPLILVTILGGYLMAGGASAVNMAYDHDIDKVLSNRTRMRPVAAGRVSPRVALGFGLTLGALSFIVFAIFVNFLAAALSLAGFFYYTVIYTMWLKRSTPQNIVIGGGAGAIPALVGWAAMANSLDWTAAALFVVVFMWTPPHFWALALMQTRNYAAANVPMLTVVAGEAETQRQVWIYTLLLIALTLGLVALGMFGLIYLAGALAAGAVFVWRAWQVRGDRSRAVALRLYLYSMAYLALLFGAMAVDRVVYRALAG